MHTTAHSVTYLLDVILEVTDRDVRHLLGRVGYQLTQRKTYSFLMVCYERHPILIAVRCELLVVDLATLNHVHGLVHLLDAILLAVPDDTHHVVRPLDVHSDICIELLDHTLIALHLHHTVVSTCGVEPEPVVRTAQLGAQVIHLTAYGDAI